MASPAGRVGLRELLATTELPSVDVQLGPAPCVPAARPSSPDSVASGLFNVHAYAAAPPAGPAPHVGLRAHGVKTRAATWAVAGTMIAGGTEGGASAATSVDAGFRGDAGRRGR